MKMRLIQKQKSKYKDFSDALFPSRVSKTTCRAVILKRWFVSWLIFSKECELFDK